MVLICVAFCDFSLYCRAPVLNRPNKRCPTEVSITPTLRSSPHSQKDHSPWVAPHGVRVQPWDVAWCGESLITNSTNSKKRQMTSHEKKTSRVLTINFQGKHRDFTNELLPISASHLRKLHQLQLQNCRSHRNFGNRKRSGRSKKKLTAQYKVSSGLVHNL